MKGFPKPELPMELHIPQSKDVIPTEDIIDLIIAYNKLLKYLKSRGI